MNVRFADKSLQLCYQHEGQAIRRCGPEVGRRYIQRVSLIQSVKTFRELTLFRALALHRLKGGCAGEWALTLQDRWRLVLVPEKGGAAVTIVEVSNHYGD